jgi:peptidoglycan/xylan/chitin deacetylase (PgdA/CDA1 family)
MQYLMFHDLRRAYFELDLARYRLTFDDGLFSQYYYYPLLKSHPAELTFFITTAFIRPGETRAMFAGEYRSHLKTKKYGYRTFIEGRYDHFMTVAEIQELAARPGVRIGVHSHFHDVILTSTHPRKRKPLSPWKLAYYQNRPEIAELDLSIRSKLAFQGYYFKDGALTRRSEAQWEDDIKYDTELSLRWMAANLGLEPDRYCFPFNEYCDKLIAILRSFGFKEFFGARPGSRSDVRGRIDIDSLLG